MKKIIQALFIILLVLIISLIIVFLFNPFNFRTKLIGGAINAYLSSATQRQVPVNSTDGSAEKIDSSADQHPLLSAEQEKTLQSYGVDVSQLPSSITPGMKDCFIEKLGQDRANQIVGGASPSAVEIFKAKACLGR